MRNYIEHLKRFLTGVPIVLGAILSISLVFYIIKISNIYVGLGLICTGASYFYGYILRNG